jgi:hypothetical protein
MSSEDVNISPSTGFLIGGCVCVGVSALAFVLSRSQRHRAAHLESAERIDLFDDLFARIHSSSSCYVAVRGLVQGELPLVSTHWCAAPIESVAVCRKQTLHVDVMTVTAQRHRDRSSHTTTSSLGDALSSVSQISEQISTSHDARWHRVTESLHEDFESVPFALTDSNLAQLHVVAPDRSLLPMTRVFNDFTAAVAPASSSSTVNNQSSTFISVNVNSPHSAYGGAPPITGDVDRRIVGTQREEFVLRCDVPLLVVGEVRETRDGSGFCIAAPSSPHLVDRPFLISSDTLDHVIAEAEASARSAAFAARVSGGIGLSLLLVASLLRSWHH